MKTFQTGAPDRDAVLGYLHRHLVGPVDGDEELLEREKPHQRYLTGILYARAAETVSEIEPGPDDDDELTEDIGSEFGDDSAEDPVNLAGQMRPSSLGISFVTSSLAAVHVELTAGIYRQVTDGWQRTEVRFKGDDAVRLVPGAFDRACTVDVFLLDRTVRVQARWRPHRDGAVVTVVVVNEHEQADGGGVDPSQCLYQVELACRPSEGEILRYPGKAHLHTQDEATELRLLYRDVPVYAIGHGGAAEWDARKGVHTVDEVRTTFLPVHVVPDVAFEVEGLDTSVLQLARLAEIETQTSALIAELRSFVSSYHAWIERTRRALDEELAPELAKAADRLLKRSSTAMARMRLGVELLESDPRSRRAFGLANRAILMQMVHGTAELAGQPHQPSANVPVAPDYDVPYGWRPFQLGFLLLTVRGVVVDGPERDIVDLIWFPTGGGKTEAYLGLAAFTIFHRRLVAGDGGAGTTVITRYTLRLLTAQQFQRAATLVMACDVLRQEQPTELGSQPISIGIWVGGGNTPNSYSDARKLLEQLSDGLEPEQGYQIEICPWCGTRIVPAGPDDENEWGITATNNSFRVFCLNRNCPFSAGLPISSIDEDLYENPPTMLVGTVDKFARAVWDRRAGAFFGSRGMPGPSLVIQDEFHLISGPLGTIVGLYEAAFDVLMSQLGAKPKIVAATATIRKADAQTRGVFGREVALFPPAGVNADDSYFVRSVADRPGRAYAGIMPQGHTPLTALVHLAAAQLQATVELDLSADAHDAYATLVAYHNSLRELGKTMILARDDVPARIGVIALAQDELRPLNDDNVVELTSNISSAAIPRILERLGRAHDAPGGVAFLASTNMVSVGVDVGRLGVMTVVGQPKTTAEYIQASSRVGRKASRPGLVVTLYSPSKPRDRSHYESFVPYHSALYSSVEPSSVTPFSVAARDRALHACLVLLMRHALGLAENSDAARFDPDQAEVRDLLAALHRRAVVAEPDEDERIRRHLERLIEEWRERADEAASDGGLTYSAVGRGKPKLLKRFTEPGPGWATLDSMRSVDADVQVWVRGTPK
ncbi:helicase-related protein [Amycolatopsis japonica]|uniref:helicase-related protein n=1 Tax=Amycolatopsis japonica TaxID=208439 RepID=UPI0033D8B214